MLAGLPVSAPSTAELASLVRSAGADELAHRLELSPPAAESPAAGRLLGQLLRGLVQPFGLALTEKEGPPMIVAVLIEQDWPRPLQEPGAPVYRAGAGAGGSLLFA